MRKCSEEITIHDVQQ
uniref:Uncharacterized protein n=1 Tax=Lepeophtheirus salmonis TaxID=72036 RepID=A0A0K2V0N8_LEPSM